MEERRGSLLGRWFRAAARGREESTPTLIHSGVVIAVGAVAGFVILVTIAIWLLLK